MQMFEWELADIITGSVDTTSQQYADGDHIQWWPGQSQD